MAIARIISAYKLSKNEIDVILGRAPFLKKYQIENSIDPSIYAGVVIKYDTKVIDMSLSTQLKNFQKLLYEIT